MKVRRDREGVGFRAFDVTLTIESEEEARALYAIFNYCPNLELFPGDAARDVRHTIGDKFSDTPNGEIANGVDYDHFYRSKKED